MITFQNQQCYLDEQAYADFPQLIKDNKVTDAGQKIVTYLYFFYNKDGKSPYANMLPTEKLSVIAIDRLSMKPEALEKLVDKHEKSIDKYEALMLTKIQRLIFTLEKRIDKLIELWNKKVVDIDEIESEMRNCKPLNELLNFLDNLKAREEKEKGAEQKTRGDKKVSFLERRIGKVK